MRFLRKTSGNEHRARGSKFSLLLLVVGLLTSLGYADSLAELENAIKGLPVEQQVEILAKSEDDSIRGQAQELVGRISPTNKAEVQALLAELKSRAAIERRLPSTSPATYAKKAEKIKRDPAFTDRAPKKTSSWLAKAIENLIKLLTPQRDRPQGGPVMPNFSLNWLVPLVWGILGGIVILLLVLIIRHFQWQGRLKRKAVALLEDDEPERTLDEWLLLADQLQSEGNYRGAVRALYLASLIRLDEANIIRFNRRETNWEHFARLQKSPLKPESLDFLSPTRHFDRVWYGQIVRGKVDVDEMRSVYFEVVAIVTQVKAA